jgi:peptide/nickel transport system ATP-binding protein
VLITHDLGVATDRSDVVGVMQGGRLVELGPTGKIATDPQHPYTRQLLDSVPSRSPLGRERRARARVERVEEPEPAGPVEGSAQAQAQAQAEGSAADAVIAVTDLRKEYGDLAAVDGISFTVRRGETFSVVGESGSGKSTTARVLTGLTSATSGSVSVLGTDVTRLGRREFRPLRRDIQIVYQNPYSSFDPRFDVFDVVAEPLRSFGPAAPFRRRRAHEEQVVAALEAATLPADFVRRHPRELSGGQRQRVAIARALVVEPQVIVLDEPISALDVSVAAQILALLDTLQRERGLTYLFISHDLAVVRAISDRLAVMQHGRIVEQGPVEDVFTAPTDEYTVRLLAAVAGRKLLGAS